MEISWKWLAPVHGSKPADVTQNAGAGQEPVRCSQLQTDSRPVPAHHSTAGRLSVTGFKIWININIIINSSYLFLSFCTQISWSVIHVKPLIYRIMPAPDTNQSDAPSIGLIPDRYPLIVELQGDYQLLASSNRYIYRYNYEYFKHIHVIFLPRFHWVSFTGNSWNR